MRLLRLLGIAAVTAIAGIVVFIAWPTTLTAAAVYLFAAAATLTVAGFIILLTKNGELR